MSSSYTPEEYQKALKAWECHSAIQRKEFIDRYIANSKFSHICPVCYKGFEPYSPNFHTTGIYCSYDCEKSSGSY